MTPTEIAESRVRGYLFVLERSLRTFLPPPIVDDAVREVQSHIRERLEQAGPSGDERATVERILAELGPPLRVAQAYSMEMTVDEAVATGRTVAIFRALWHVAASTVGGFFAALGLFVGYTLGASFLIIALLKPVFPRNVGFAFRGGMPMGFGAYFPLEQGVEVRGGYEIIPVSLVIGLLVLVATHRGARRLLAWVQRRREENRALRVAPRS
jgi:hypothetical protein